MSHSHNHLSDNDYLAQESSRSFSTGDAKNKTKDKGHEDIENSPVLNEISRKDNKTKRESHRKEKRRKKRSHVRSSSSNSSD